MFKLFSLFLLCVTGGSLGAALYPEIEQNINLPELSRAGNLADHAKDFLDLIDTEAVISVVLEHLSDQEVLSFIGFLLGEQFAELLVEFQSMEEFKEAVDYLTSKGYDVVSILNFINSIYELPPFGTSPLRSKGGITNMIEEIIAVLPVDKMKELFEEKLENDKEVLELFNTLTSEEFLDIMKRMRSNPTFLKGKETLESFGFNFKYLCLMAKEIFGEYYLGIFCDQ